jgi:ribosomal protein S3AE
MAKAKRKDKESAKIKKKKWYSIVAPPLFSSMVLGEMPGYDAQTGLGKSLIVNLMTVTGDVKNQSVNLKFTVTSIQDDKLMADPMGYILSPSFIKRVVRRRHSRLDEAYTLATTDGKTVTIKPLMITRTIANRSVMSALRRECQKSVTAAVTGATYDDLLSDIITTKFQKETRKGLSKIFPLKSFEVKKCLIVSQRKTAEA